MILYYLFLVFSVVGAALLLFFIFSVLFPAMKRQSFSVDNVLFAEHEVHHNTQDEALEVHRERRGVVCCSPEKQFAGKRLTLLAGQSCALITEVYGSHNDCPFSCIGLGDCCAVCPQEAIVIEHGCAVITTRCIGCGTCVSSCPKHLIQLVPKAQTTITLCAADARCKTSCSECRKEQKIPVVGKKDFKLWRSWCRIFYSSS